MIGIVIEGLMGSSLKRFPSLMRRSVPLYGKLEKDFIGSIIKYTVDVLDKYVPEIISCIHEANHWKKEGVSPTFH